MPIQAWVTKQLKGTDIVSSKTTRHKEKEKHQTRYLLAKGIKFEIILRRKQPEVKETFHSFSST